MNLKDHLQYEGLFNNKPTGVIYYGREYNLFKKELTSILNKNNICER